MEKFIWHTPDLQLFACEGEATVGETGENLAVAGQESASEADPDTEFDDLINGKFKEQFSKRTQAIIDKRFKQTKELEAFRDKAQPLLGALYEKYGIEEGNVDSLNQALSDEKNNLQAEAVQKNLRKKIGSWIKEGEELKRAVPDFDLRTEIRGDKTFGRLLLSGIPLKTAYETVHRDEILSEADLPKKFFAYTPCFRREAGSHRADERGMVRGHQFNKVEMFQFTTPEGSDAAFDELVTKAENLVAGLGLHFRTVKLAAGDCSASMARTYDIEILIPSMNGYKEVSSVSNARDFQARRGNCRYRRADGKLDFVHTLNGSGLATSRIFPAIVEQNQRADGSIVVPEVLRKYLGGLEIITK